MRRYLLLFVSGLFSLYAHSVLAFSWDDLWINNSQQIEKLIEKKSFDEAESRAESIEQQALVKYRAEDYESAAQLYQQSEQNYNRATALVRAGDFESALEAYDQVLADSPDYKDAMHNRKIAQKLGGLQKQQDGEGQQGDEDGQQKNDQSSGNEPDNSQGQSPQQSDEPGQGDEQSDSRSNQDSEPQDSSESPPEPGDDDQQNDAENEDPTNSADGDKAHDEKQQAMDQWLQQVPDDPAGLLRARIIREHQRSYGSTTDRAQAW